jgi:hypothetical protein
MEKIRKRRIRKWRAEKGRMTKRSILRKLAEIKIMRRWMK